MPHLLEVSGLSAAYGLVPALHRVDFHADRGEVVGILGHNGMGKTTLMRAIMGYVKVTGGEIRFEGASVLGQPVNARARAGIGLVPQGRQIFPNLSVEENLQVGIPGKAAVVAQTVEEMLELFPRLKRLLDRRGGALSGGEQQLLALARCLCRRPKLMLLDEPTEGIQPSIVQAIEDVIRSLKGRMTILLVEQYYDFAASLADSYVVIDRGEIAEQGRGADMDAERIGRFLTV